MASKTTNRRGGTPEEMRVAAGLSVARLARLADVDRKTVERILAGGQGVSVSSLEAVARVLAVSAPDLLAACERARGAA